MKKITLLILLLTSVTFAATAQLNMGVTTRAGYPSFTGDDFVHKADLGMTGGMSFAVEYKIADIFFVQGDLGYTYNMITYKTEPYGYPVFFLHNLDFRALAKVKANNDGAQPYLKLGPSVSMILVSANYDGEAVHDNPLTFGLNVEGGVLLSSPDMYRVELGAFYQRDFTKFINALEYYKQSFGVALTMYFN